MKKRLTPLLCLLTTLVFGQLQENNYSKLYLDSIFSGHKGTFVLYNLNKDKYEVYNIERAKQVLPVHSTSKILWTIIALEEGLVNEDDIMIWDSIEYPRKNLYLASWANNHNITSALKYSVNWYFMELMELMSPSVVEKYFKELNYQPAVKVEKVNYYALTFNVRKSAFEQVEFLKNIYLNRYKLSNKTQSVIYAGMLFAEEESYKLYLRAGLGPPVNGTQLGWLIGLIENNNQVSVFALNVENEGQKAGELRYDYCFRILKALELKE